ncbi:hypothetical protein ACOME3_001994 [Neoechinorhynchus agilis]
MEYCPPKILFYDTLINHSNESKDDLAVPSVHHIRFQHPIYVSEFRVMGSHDLETERFSDLLGLKCDTQPDRLKVEVFGINLNERIDRVTVFQQLCTIRYSGGGKRGMSAEVNQDIPTERLVFRGLFERVTIAVIGVFARAKTSRANEMGQVQPTVVGAAAGIVSGAVVMDQISAASSFFTDSSLIDAFSQIASIIPSTGPTIPTIALPQSRHNVHAPCMQQPSRRPSIFPQRNQQLNLPNLNMFIQSSSNVLAYRSDAEVNSDSSFSQSSGIDIDSDIDDVEFKEDDESFLIEPSSDLLLNEALT